MCPKHEGRPGGTGRPLKLSQQSQTKYSQMQATGKASRDGDLRRFHREAAGVIEIMVIRKRRDAPWLVTKLLAGEPNAWALYRALGRWLDRIEVNRPLCVHAGCPHEFSAAALPDTFLICVPWRDDRSVCLTGGVCGTCAASNDDGAISEWVKQLWPDGRIIDMPRGSGTA